MKDEVSILLESMTYDTEYCFLDMGKHKDELMAVAEKAKVVLPAKDLAIFKGRYALTDAQNRNGCTLPKEEVEKALETLAHKSVDLDHLRKRVVGHWIDAKIEGEEIISYGLFFKGNFPEDYETIQTLMEAGNLKISFEAYGSREFNENGSYNLTDIEFAGGALLIKEKPAFPTAEVLEMAKVMTPPSELLHIGKKEKVDKISGTKGEKAMEHIELARLFIWDIEGIMGAVHQAQDKKGNRLDIIDILSIDFETSKVRVKAFRDAEKNDFEEVVFEIDLTPRVKFIEGGKEVSRKVKSVKELSSSDKKEDKIEDETKSKDKKELETDMGDTTDKGKTTDKVEDTSTQATQTTGTPQESEALKAELSKVKEQISAKDETIKSLTEKVDGFEKAEKEATVKERRKLLGDIAKDMKDEDVLDEAKFVLAQKDKEIADLKAREPEKASDKGAGKGEDTRLTTGATDKDEGDPVLEKSSRVHTLAFGKDSSEDKK